MYRHAVLCLVLLAHAVQVLLGPFHLTPIAAPCCDMLCCAVLHSACQVQVLLGPCDPHNFHPDLEVKADVPCYVYLPSDLPRCAML
jgi:hypothetical protein